MNELTTSGQLTIPEQPELFYGLERIDRAKPKYHATAERFRMHRPVEYRIAVKLLADGRHSRREMEDLLHVSQHTLEAVEILEAENLATLRSRCARKNLALHEMSLDKAQELIPSCTSLKDLAISSGIFAEKGQLLAGEATARLESVQPVNVIERFAQLCNDLTKRVEARVIDLDGKNLLGNCAASSASDPASDAGARSRSEDEAEATFHSITSYNKRHIKSNCVDSEAFTNNQTETDNCHNESRVLNETPGRGSPAAAPTPGEGGVALSIEGADRDG